MPTVPVLAADDTHLNILKMMFMSIARERKDTNLPVYEMVESAMDGLDLIECYKTMSAKGELPDLITLDIEMPKADGLWTLHEITKRHKPHPPIVMISSLHGKELELKYAKSIAQFAEQRGEMSEAQKHDLLERVAERIRNGQLEPGKVNTLTDAGLRLGFNPIQLAEFLGAKGYIVKPYKSTGQVTSVLDGVYRATSSGFLTGIAS